MREEERRGEERRAMSMWREEGDGERRDREQRGHNSRQE